MRRSLRALVPVLSLGAVLLAAGCGGGGNGQEDVRDVAADLARDEGGEDVPVIIKPDEGPGDTGPADEGRDTAPDAAPDPGADAGDVPPDGIEPGAPGWPCSVASECNSEFCMETPDGQRCARLCVTDCPEGARCLQVQAAPDTVFACVYVFARLCQPCLKDLDCQVGYVPGYAGCVEGPLGSYCGSPCTRDQDCPEGYGCDEVETLGGQVVMQCTKDEGECDCNPAAVAAAGYTVCYAENEFGRCPGTRRCEAGGLTDCDAPAPAADVCNGKDDDCNGTTDDRDPDPCLIKNAYGSCPGTSGCAGGKDVCLGTPASPESCNGVDDDCDGLTDEEGANNCRTYYKDADADQYGLLEDSRCLCAPAAPYRTLAAGDCDDTDAEKNPGRTEACNGKDDDCNAIVDDPGTTGCVKYHRDGDGDGYGITTDSKCLCQPAAPYTATLDKDCNDQDRDIHPNATEKCNGRDDDCDQATDPQGSQGCSSFYFDNDQDQYGSGARAARCLCNPDYATKFTSRTSTDCNDNDAQINPGKLEVCADGVDNNCNSAIDENGAQGCQNRWIDGDGDGWGGGDPVCSCAMAPPYNVEKGGDCADGDPTRNPGAKDLCGDGIDGDCDGKIDEAGSEGCQNRWEDRDLDGFGTGAPQCLCAPSGWYTAPWGGDCDESDETRNPGALEVCTAAGQEPVDENCNDVLDEEEALGCSPWYYDWDRDGFGAGLPRCLCVPAGLYDATLGTDCNDLTNAISPLATEACGDGIDNDCDQLVDEAGALNCKTYYFDGDRDGYGVTGNALCLCTANVALRYDTLLGGDCDDTTVAVRPGQPEVCEPAGQPTRDDNCNNLLNEEDAIGCDNYWYDYDRDGHGTPDRTPRCFCDGGNPALRFTSLFDDDCNDLDAGISGGFDERCDTPGIDDNCNGRSEEQDAADCTPYYKDNDRDGYGLTGDTKCLCAPDPLGVYVAPEPGDCDDNDNATHPGGAACGKDGNCDGVALDPTESCDDGNLVDWDGCTACIPSELRVNATMVLDQQAPATVALAGGAYVTAFQATRTTTAEDASARLLSATGVLDAGGEITLNVTTSNFQGTPAVTALPATGFAAVWESSGQDGSGYGIYGARFTATGGRSGGEFLVNGTTALDQRYPSVGALSDGRLVVAWQSYLQDGGDWGVFARRIKTDGLPDGAEFQVNVTTAGPQDQPVVAVLPDNRFIIVWRGQVDRGGGVNDRDVFFRLYNADGSTNGGERLANGTTASDQQVPALALTGTDSFVVAWQSSNQDGSGTGVYARRFALDGTALADEFRVNSYPAGDQGDPAVAGTPGGAFVVAWRSEAQDGSGQGVFVQRYTAAGAASGGEFQANTYTANDQYQPSVAATNDHFWVTWTSYQQDGGGFGIFGRRYGW